jgi:hypothetical protein
LKESLVSGVGAGVGAGVVGAGVVGAGVVVGVGALLLLLLLLLLVLKSEVKVISDLAVIVHFSLAVFWQT